jgi:predicted ATP-dependent endonuclease of OLD family
MLRQVLIRNFQKHKRLAIKIGERITTITGRSDVGKSAIIRALRFALLNQHTAADVRHGQKRMLVRAEFDEGRVTRERRGSTNLYKLDAQGFQAFGKNIPEPVQEVLQLTADNFQQQHDAPFWIGLGRPALAREINRVVDLEVIDHSLKVVAGHVRSSKTRAELYEERVTSASAAVKSLQHVSQMRVEFDLMKCEAKGIADRHADIDLLQELIEQESEFRTTVDAHTEKQKHIKAIRELAELAESTEQKRMRLDSLITRYGITFAHMKERAIQQAGLKAELFKEGVCPLCQATTKH